MKWFTEQHSLQDINLKHCCGQVFNPLYSGNKRRFWENVHNSDRKVLESIHNTFPGKGAFPTIFPALARPKISNSISLYSKRREEFCQQAILSSFKDTLADCPYM